MITRLEPVAPRSSNTNEAKGLAHTVTRVSSSAWRGLTPGRGQLVAGKPALVPGPRRPDEVQAQVRDSRAANKGRGLKINPDPDSSQGQGRR